MKIYRLVVDDRPFPISDEQELARIKRRIVTAVRRNGGFVALREAGGRLVDVLITNATRVRVERVEGGERLGGKSPERSGTREDFTRYSVDELTFDADLAF